MKFDRAYKEILSDTPIDVFLELDVAAECPARMPGVSVDRERYEKTLADIGKYGKINKAFGPYVCLAVPANKIVELLEKDYVTNGGLNGSLEAMKEKNEISAMSELARLFNLGSV